MGLKHQLDKFLIYFRPNAPYWRMIQDPNYAVSSKLGPFFGMHLKDRLFDGHYDRFDEKGLPIRIQDGNIHYNCTTLCSYALAHWELYLESGENKHLKPLWEVQNYLMSHHEETTYGGIVFPFKGLLSAMNQGEALSVTARCHELEPSSKWTFFAEKVLLPYEVAVKDHGVLGEFSSLDNVYWYEEKASIPGKHILNGMCYALLGLHDIATAMPKISKAKVLFDNGVSYLVKALSLYDQGFWSWYWIDENPPHYIASMMYHNLHIIQLRHLHKLSGEEKLLEYANRFDAYQTKFLNRIWAGVELYKGKRRK